jgi:ribonucleoside-diphosphate reductase alpha chain
MKGLPPGLSSGYSRLGGNVPGKVFDGLIPEPSKTIIDVRASKEAPESMEPGPVKDDKKQQIAVARAQGYTGDMCSHCNSMQMKISGHCLVCEACGTTTGCS